MRQSVLMLEKDLRVFFKKPPNTACTRLVGVCAFSGIFLASGFSCFQAEITHAPLIVELI
jgi:hypothetical protein